MTTTLAFDVYGTLIDTQGVLVELHKHIGDRAPEFSRAWRAKQLEYSFRRGLMQKYVDFSSCTKEAFHYTALVMKVALGPSAEQCILDAYNFLPAFPDVEAGLAILRASGFRLFAFSNGLPLTIDTLLFRAGIREFFEGIVSVDDVKSFKPSPIVYRHFLDQARSSAADAWLISSNPFDVIGALSAGMRAAWVRRSAESVFDPWGIEPTITVPSLIRINDKLKAGF